MMNWGSVLPEKHILEYLKMTLNAQELVVYCNEKRYKYATSSYQVPLSITAAGIRAILTIVASWFGLIRPSSNNNEKWSIMFFTIRNNNLYKVKWGISEIGVNRIKITFGSLVLRDDKFVANLSFLSRPRSVLFYLHRMQCI